MKRHQRISRIAVLLALLISLLTFVMSTAARAATACNEEIRGETVVGSLTVGAGQACQLLTGTTVIGSVVVAPGGSLLVSDSTILDRIEATGHADLVMVHAVIQGNVTVTGGTGSGTATEIFESSIAGQLTVTGNEQFGIGVVRTEVGDSVTIADNDVASIFRLEGNTIGSSLRCSGNTSDDIFAIANNATILGQMIGGCA